MGSVPDSTLVAEPLSSPPSPNGLDMVSEPEFEVDCGSSGGPSSELGFAEPRSCEPAAALKTLGIPSLFHYSNE